MNITFYRVFWCSIYLDKNLFFLKLERSSHSSYSRFTRGRDFARTTNGKEAPSLKNLFSSSSSSFSFLLCVFEFEFEREREGWRRRGEATAASSIYYRSERARAQSSFFPDFNGRCCCCFRRRRRRRQRSRQNLGI